MPTPKLAFVAKRAATPQFIDKATAEKIEEALHRRISQRAYILFEESGRQNGHDQKNWLQAKWEILQSLEIRESGSWVALTASIPDVSPESIQIYVDANRVLVKAEKAEAATLSESSAPAMAAESFLAAELNPEVDPATASASFKDQTLNLMVKKIPTSAATRSGDS